MDTHSRFFFFFSLCYPPRREGWGNAPHRLVASRQPARPGTLSLSLSLSCLALSVSLPRRLGFGSCFSYQADYLCSSQAMRTTQGVLISSLGTESLKPCLFSTNSFCSDVVGNEPGLLCFRCFDSYQQLPGLVDLGKHGPKMSFHEVNRNTLLQVSHPCARTLLSYICHGASSSLFTSETTWHQACYAWRSTKSFSKQTL